MNIRADLRDAWRLIHREPSFAAIATLTVGLGVAAATLLFSLVYGVLLRPLPWRDAARLVQVTETRQGATRNFPGAFTNGSYLAWADHPSTIDALAAWTTDKVTLTSKAGAPERIDIVSASPGLFPLLNVSTSLGALFRPGDELDGRPPVVVISHALWQQRFGSDPNIIGQAVRLDGETRSVIGVMPATFAFPNADVRAWVPFHVHAVKGDTPGATYIELFRCMARLRSGVTPAQASAEATARARSTPALNLVGMAVFGTNGAADVHVVPALEASTEDVRQPLLLFLAAVGLLVVAATGNVASLQLVRAATRRRTTAIRTALGASAGRLARPLVLESIALGLTGGLLGLGMAAALVRLLPAVMPPHFPRLEDVRVDWPVALFGIALAIVSAMVFGAVPALLGRRVDLVAVLNEDGLAPAGGSARTTMSRARRVIIVGQVAIASVLLVAGLLLAESFSRMLTADRGYNPVNVLTAEVALPDASYSGVRRMELMDRTLERLRTLPGVVAAAAGTGLPFSSREMLMAFTMPRPGKSSAPAEVHTAVRHVSDGWFAALGIRLIDGRAFTPADSRTSPHVVIVNRTFARSYLGDRPVGQLLPLELEGAPPDWEVVGVVEDVRRHDVSERPQPELFVDYRQLPKAFEAPAASFIVRTTSRPATYAAELRRLVRREDDSLAFDSMATLDDRVRDSLAEPRLYALLLGAFALSALLVAAVGLFAVLSYSVTQRAREIGVRSALGARPSDIVRLVVSQALGLAGAGIVLGLALAAAAVRALSGFLYGIGPYDPVTLAAVVLVLLLVSLAAAALPARRAARVDPLSVIRT